MYVRTLPTIHSEQALSGYLVCAKQSKVCTKYSFRVVETAQAACWSGVHDSEVV